jgi:NADH-quinone oxidoreductase subunit L
MFQFAWLMLAFPAAGALIILLLGNRLPHKVIGALASAAVAASFAVAVALFFSLLGLPEEERQVTVELWKWMDIGAFHVP